MLQENNRLSGFSFLYFLRHWNCDSHSARPHDQAGALTCTSQPEHTRWVHAARTEGNHMLLPFGCVLSPSGAPPQGYDPCFFGRRGTRASSSPWLVAAFPSWGMGLAPSSSRQPAVQARAHGSRAELQPRLDSSAERFQSASNPLG